MVSEYFAWSCFLQSNFSTHFQRLVLTFFYMKEERWRRFGAYVVPFLDVSFKFESEAC
jgi:hypothetical protein